jgi:hypothetical protein
VGICGKFTRKPDDDVDIVDLLLLDFGVSTKMESSRREVLGGVSALKTSIPVVKEAP